MERMNISRYYVYYTLLCMGAKVFFEQSLNTVKDKKCSETRREQYMSLKGLNCWCMGTEALVDIKVEIEIHTGRYCDKTKHHTTFMSLNVTSLNVRVSKRNSS
jgi:hypothetical protein